MFLFNLLIIIVYEPVVFKNTLGLIVLSSILDNYKIIFCFFSC